MNYEDYIYEEVVHDFDSDIENINPATTKRPRLDYHEIKRFTDENVFEQWIKGSEWTKEDNRGKQIQHYYCKFNRRKKGYSCKARLRVIRPFDSNLIRVEQSDVEHNHEPTVTLEGPMKLTDEANKFIDDQLILGRTPQQIRNAFQDAYRDHLNDVPNLLQIQNRIQRVRRKKTVTQPTLEEFEKAIIDKFAPNEEDEHHPFLVHSKIDQEAGKFVFVITSKKLQELAQPQLAMHLDATYKIVHSGHPIFISGFSDANHKFFPVYLAICSNEDEWCFSALVDVIKEEMGEDITIIGDGARSITAACEAAELRRATCWFHAKQAIKKRMQKKQFDWGPINNGLNLLQCSSNELEFFQAARLLDKHFEQLVDAQTLDEWRAWMREWVGRYDENGPEIRFEAAPIHGWYEGFGTHLSTNNGLESINEKLKTRETLRKKLPLMAFLDTTAGTVFHWSSCPDHQVAETFPKVEKRVFDDAAALRQEGRNLIKLMPARVFIMPSSQFLHCTREQLGQTHQRLVMGQYQSWNEFANLKTKIHIISPSQNVPNLYFCSCFIGCKKAPCKHSVLVMHFLNKTLDNPFPPSNPIEPKRKKGRPPLAKNALSFE